MNRDTLLRFLTLRKEAQDAAAGIIASGSAGNMRDLPEGVLKRVGEKFASLFTALDAIEAHLLKKEKEDLTV